MTGAGRRRSPRGVNVRALIAHTNSGGEKRCASSSSACSTPALTVSRSGDDLVRYHAKMMMIDGRQLHVHGFNFTELDIEKSRSFGARDDGGALVQEAQKLFEADCDRQPYTPGGDRSSSAR